MKKGVYSVVYMFFLTFCFTSVVSGIKYLNEERIRTNTEARLQSVVLDVLNIPFDASKGPDEVVQIYKKRVKLLRLEKDTVYAGYDDDHVSLQGFAISMSGPGFWGPVSCMIGITKDLSRITGVNFYENTETPGLGARITEAWFQDQFAGLLLRRQSGSERFFSLKQPGTQLAVNELSAITGATQTSEAVEKFLNREITRFVQEVIPLIMKEI